MVKIGDMVKLVAPSGASRFVLVTDVHRCIFDKKTVLAIEFNGRSGDPVLLPVKHFDLEAVYSF